MKLSISNIAWSQQHDGEMYLFLYEQGIKGLEIAPTRIFGTKPYERISDVVRFAHGLYSNYNLKISSMQSIWFGMTENIFSSSQDRQILIDYTKKAIDFAQAVNCHNLVFGCPRNRVIPNDTYLSIAVDFFKVIGTYASQHNTVISLEANPVIYNTNFINTTYQAFELCKQIQNNGIKVNLDLGAMIYNNEDMKPVRQNISLVNHIHISEPYLAPIKPTQLHHQLKALDYDGYVSIEMKNTENLDLVKQTVLEIKEILY